MPNKNFFCIIYSVDITFFKDLSIKKTNQTYVNLLALANNNLEYYKFIKHYRLTSAFDILR